MTNEKETNGNLFLEFLKDYQMRQKVANHDKSMTIALDYLIYQYENYLKGKLVYTKFKGEEK